MIRVLFFASIRERLGRSEMSLEHDASRGTVAALRRHLGTQLPGATAALAGADMLVAVNRSVTDDDHPIADGDEVAFYPPVTGG